MIFRLADPGRFDAVKREIETDPRLTLEAKREAQFYADQSETLAKFIGILGTSISAIFSIGAVIGAMITMYASVAARTAEIGTLRALGFSRGAILAAFLVEALALGLLGGMLGLLAASFMQAFTISTTNFQTFAELAFSLHAHAGDRAGLARVRACHGLRRRIPARGAGGAAVDRRRAAGGVMGLGPLFAIPTLIWGSTWFAIKFQLGVVAPGGLGRLPLRARRADPRCVVRGDGRSLALPRRAHAWMALQGVTFFGLNYVAVYEAEQRLASGPRRRRVLDDRVHDAIRRARGVRHADRRAHAGRSRRSA